MRKDSSPRSITTANHYADRGSRCSWKHMYLRIQTFFMLKIIFGIYILRTLGHVVGRTQDI